MASDPPSVADPTSFDHAEVTSPRSPHKRPSTRLAPRRPPSRLRPSRPAPPAPRSHLARPAGRPDSGEPSRTTEPPPLDLPHAPPGTPRPGRSHRPCQPSLPSPRASVTSNSEASSARPDSANAIATVKRALLRCRGSPWCSRAATASRPVATASAYRLSRRATSARLASASAARRSSPSSPASFRSAVSRRLAATRSPVRMSCHVRFVDATSTSRRRPARVASANAASPCSRADSYAPTE